MNKRFEECYNDINNNQAVTYWINGEPWPILDGALKNSKHTDMQALLHNKPWEYIMQYKPYDSGLAAYHIPETSAFLNCFRLAYLKMKHNELASNVAEGDLNLLQFLSAVQDERVILTDIQHLIQRLCPSTDGIRVVPGSMQARIPFPSLRL